MRCRPISFVPEVGANERTRNDWQDELLPSRLVPLSHEFVGHEAKRENIEKKDCRETRGARTWPTQCDKSAAAAAAATEHSCLRYIPFNRVNC